MFKKSLAAAGLVVAFVFIPTAAQALDCINVSKPPAECGAVCTDGPIIHGNWAWLPSVFPGALEVWAFVPPGTVEEVGLPGRERKLSERRGLRVAGECHLRLAWVGAGVAPDRARHPVDGGVRPLIRHSHREVRH